MNGMQRLTVIIVLPLQKGAETEKVLAVLKWGGGGGATLR